MSPIEFVMLKLRKQLILAAGIVFGSLWLLLVAYLLTGSDKQQIAPSPGSVAVHAPSVIGGGMPSATYSAPKASMSLIHRTAPSPVHWSYVENAPKAAMSSTSMHIHQTSSATVHVIGGGGSGIGGIATTSGGNNSGKGVRYTAMAYTGAIYTPKARNAVTEVGASNAHSEATTTTQDGAATISPHIRKVGSNPHGPFPDPIGDVTWGLMILLAAGYGYHVFLRKRPQSKETKR